MKYLVMRKDAIKRGGTAQLQSSCFPIEVEMDNFGNHTAEEVVRKACNQLNDGYSPGRYSYVVVPMTDALIVNFRKPQPVLEVSISNYDC